MSRSNYDKPFYVDVGTSIVSIRCASNHDVVARYAIVLLPHTLQLAKDICDRMNREAEIGRPRRNCDVGTAEEQAERHARWCAKTRDFSCAEIMCRRCFAKWSQMPYEEGGVS